MIRLEFRTEEYSKTSGTRGGDEAALENERGKRVALEVAEQSLIVLSKRVNRTNR
jgi:hypothetical protein